ncbi:MAG: panC [Firmicutes bacterium]|nr:panC [Bacillota bacterium]
MKIITTVSELKAEIRAWKKDGFSIGLVPTMGFLHEGHESLIKRAVSENDKVVVSIFVNPIQFGPNEDFESYPRDLNKDAALCEANRVSAVFAPDVAEMYYRDSCTIVDVSYISEPLCGRKRPGHFRGVCTVVSKLFNLTKADRAYFGEKDAQQLAVVKRMVRDLNFDVEVKGCPIVREADGLAKSSRNTYLNEKERAAALVLSRSLFHAREHIRSLEGRTAKAKDVIRMISDEIMNEPMARIDYVEIVDSENLRDADDLKGGILIALAVFIGKTRLIDNIMLEI